MMGKFAKVLWVGKEHGRETGCKKWGQSRAWSKGVVRQCSGKSKGEQGEAVRSV